MGRRQSCRSFSYAPLQEDYNSEWSAPKSPQIESESDNCELKWEQQPGAFHGSPEIRDCIPPIDRDDWTSDLEQLSNQSCARTDDSAPHSAPGEQRQRLVAPWRVNEQTTADITATAAGDVWLKRASFPIEQREMVTSPLPIVTPLKLSLHKVAPTMLRSMGETMLTTGYR